jgi:serine/threonine-protein kinase
LEGALEVSGPDRQTFLDRACGNDAALRRELDTLLSAQEVCEGPVERLASAFRRPPATSDAAPRRIGPYAILRELGRGGMGVVYLARRTDGEYERDVALKVARGAVHEPHMRERILVERQILATLSHRGIATLYDGGVTDDGHPYFTMEYVEGQRIDEFCDANDLSVQARLPLFLQVCEAVAAAHRSLVVHRDLKPGNVLVTDDGSVRLLDFGIAKLLVPVQPGEATGPATRFFSRDFASPEQVAGLPITTTSDVYSLGAMLYFLLTGRSAHRFADDSPAAVERSICVDEPVRPSDAAPARARALRGDLDNILLKALSKEPERRYASVEALADDIRRHLQHLPVAARSEAWSYRVGKFVRRHRVPAIAAILIVATLLAGVVGVVIQARRAQAAAERAQRVSRLLTDLFALAEPGRFEHGALTARTLLDQGAARIETELAGDPATQAEMYLVVGRVYANLALHDSAERFLNRSLAVNEQTHGPDSVQTAAGAEALAHLYFNRSEYARAERLYRRALAIRRLPGSDPVQLATTLAGLGAVVSATGRHEQAEPVLREALELRRRAPDESGAGIVDTLYELGLALLRGGRAESAAPLFREAVERARSDPRAPGRIRVGSLLNLARIVHRFERRPADAVPLYHEALSLSRQLFPQDHPETATCLGELARAYRDVDRAVEAEQTAREALAMWRQLHGDRHRETILSAQTLAEILSDRGADAEAENLFRRYLRTAQSDLGAGNPVTLLVQGSLADFLAGRGRLREALSLREAELAVAQQAFGEDDVYVARALTALGLLQVDKGNSASAEPFLRRALAVRERLHRPGHWRIGEAQMLLGAVLLQRRRFEEAERLLQAASATLKASRSAPRTIASTADGLLASALERRPSPMGELRLLGAPSGRQ